MNEFFPIFVRLMAGIILGGFFFVGLWWTVERGVTSRNPALLFLGSTLLRTGVALGGFYILGHGNWANILVGLLGFFIARLAVVHLTRPANERPHAT